MANVAKKSLLTFIENVQRAKSGHKKALYKCECGSVREYYVCNVNSLHTTCCGCRRDTSSYKKHGLIKHPLYWIHSGIVQRCTNPSNPLYPFYGGRGVMVCEEWLNDFKTFYDWCISNGWQDGLEIDKDTKGGNIYSPDNCLIVTHKENSNKRRNNHFIEYAGQRLTIQEWSDYYGINSGELRYRLKKNNWDLEAALAMKIRSKSKSNKNSNNG